MFDPRSPKTLRALRWNFKIMLREIPNTIKPHFSFSVCEKGILAMPKQWLVALSWNFRCMLRASWRENLGQQPNQIYIVAITLFGRPNKVKWLNSFIRGSKVLSSNNYAYGAGITFHSFAKECRTQIKTYCAHASYQKGVSAISKENLRILSWTL